MDMQLLLPIYMRQGFILRLRLYNCFCSRALSKSRKARLLLAERPEIFPGMYVTTKPRLLKRLFLMNVKISTEVKVKAITDEGIIIEKGGMEAPIAIDTFTYSLSTRSQKPYSKRS